MATEEQAREAADGKEVQVEAVDLEPLHMQTHLDSKLSSMEIKNVAETIDSTEGTLKIPGDQVLVDAPSEIKLHLEHNLNGTSSSLNGHMDEENKISNEQLHEDSKRDPEQVEAALDGESTDHNNKINEEENDCLSHGETTTKDSSLSKHQNEEEPKGDDKKDEDSMPETLKTNSDTDQSNIVDQLDHNMDPAKATKDTQPSSMENVPNAEVVTEACAEVQSPLYPNLDGSDAILDRNTETDEAAREDGAIHLEHGESFPDDTSTAQHTEEVVKAEGQQSKQADAMDADVVQEDIPKCEETGVPEEMSKSEHADVSTIVAQEVFHQQPSEDTSDPAYENKEQTSFHSSIAASDDGASKHDSTICEPPVDIQVQNKKSLEETKYADVVDTEAAMQKSCIAFEEVTPEYHVATTEHDPVETNNTESAETLPSSEEDKVESGVTERGQTTGDQEVDNVASTEEIMDNVAENIVELSMASVDEASKEKNMLIAEDITEKHMLGIESEATKNTEPIETEADSDQRDNTPVCEKEHMRSALEINEIEATRTEAVPEESNASVSEEASPEDYVTESETTSDVKEVNTTESLEAIKGDKDTKTREMPDQNNMDSAGKSTQENNAPESEPTSEIQPEEETKSEEMKVTESSPEISATVFHEQIQENNPTTSELQVMESGGVRNIEATEVQAIPHQLSSEHPEEKATEETTTSSEPQTLELVSVEKINDTQATKPQDISQQSIISPSEKSVPGEIAKEDIVTIEPGDGHQQPQDPELADSGEIKTNKSQEIASSITVSNYEERTSEDNVIVRESNPETQAENLLSAELEDTENVKGHGALAGEAAQEENVETEAIIDISPVQEPKLEETKNIEPVGTEDNIAPSDLPAERMEKDTVEIEAIPYESLVASIREVAENDISTEITPHADIQPVLKQELVEDKCISTTEKQRETQQIAGSASDELIPTEDMATAEPACETPLQNVTAQGIKDSEDAQTDQFSNLDSFPSPGEAAQEIKLPRIEPTSDVQEVQEPGSIGIKAMETEDQQQHRVYILEEPAVDNKPNVDDTQVHEEKPAELRDNEAKEAEPVLEQDNAPVEMSELGNDPDCFVQPAQQAESSKASEDRKLLKEETSEQKIITLEDTATDDIVEDETDPLVGMEQEHEQKSVETSDVQQIRGIEATEAEDHQQHRVSILEEPAVDNKPDVDDQQVHEKNPAELKDNEAMEAAPVLVQGNICTPDNAPEDMSELGNDPDCCVQPAQQVESSKDSEDSKPLKEEEISDQKIITLEDTATDDTVQDETDPPVGMEQEHEQESVETSDVQVVQELGLTEQTGGIEATETEDHQQHRFSTLEEPAVDNKPDVDDHQVHEKNPAELKDNEAMEAEPVLEQGNIGTPDNAPEKISELGNDPDCCVQPAQQVESSRDIEDSKLLKEEETSDQKIITLEDTATKDIVEDETDPPVGMEQEHEPKSVEEVNDISANEAKENFDTSQPDALDKLTSESNTKIEPNDDIQLLNDFKTKEMKGTEGINDGDISCEQTEIASSAEPSPTDIEIAPQEHPVESHEEKLGNEAENAMLAHGIKDEIQTSAEQKDAFHLGESAPTTREIKNLVDEDVIQSSGKDTLKSLNSTDQIKEGENAGTEHNSSQKSSEHHGEYITHVQDKDINKEPVAERGTAEAFQALIENDAHVSQDDTMKSGEQINDQRQAGDVEHQAQTCESSVDDDVVQKVILDERHEEEEDIESQKEKLQGDVQKYKDEGVDIGHEPLVESKNIENGTANRTEETDMIEAGQTEAVVNEILKIEKALQTSEDSIPSITDTIGTDKGVEEENRPNSANTSDADPKMDKQEDQENTRKDNIESTDSTSGLDETTDEITNKEDPIAIPYSVESDGHEDKECTIKINDDLVVIQKVEKEIVTGMQENKEMQNEPKVVHHVESHTKAEEEEVSQLCSNEPYNEDTNIDETAHNTTEHPREIEKIGENEGLSSIYKPVVETSEQNNVEQDLSIHQKVEDEKLESTADNAVELEATQQKVDTSNVDTNNDDQFSTSNSLTKHQNESADDALQLETEGNTFDKADEIISYDKTEASNTSVPEIVTFNEEICDKVTGTEGGLSDESLKTFGDTSRNLDVSSVVMESNEESTNVEMEEHKLAAPAHPTMDENTPQQEISVSEKPLPAEPEEQEDDPIHKKQVEESMHEPDFGDDQKEIEQDLPVSNFLMNLILGKENSDANGHSEPDAETKQEETRDDNSCSIIPKQKESLALPPIENNVEDKPTVEQEKKDVECPEEKHEMVEEQTHDLKLGTETSLEAGAELNKNSHHLELPPYQDKVQDEISNEILSEEAAKVFTKMEAEDTAIPSIKQDDKEFDTVCQGNTEVATQNEIGSLKNNLDDFNNTKTSEEDILGEGQTGLLPECLNGARSVNSVTEQTLMLTESGMTDAKSLPSEADSVPNPVCETQDKIIESSIIGATSIPDIQVESKEDKTEEKKPTTTARGEVAEEPVDISNDNPQKIIGPEVTSNEQEPQIAEQVSDTEIALSHEKEISAGISSTFMDRKEHSNASVKEGDNTQTDVEIQVDGSNNNQDKQEAADNKTEMESEKLEEYNIQEKQGNSTEEKYPKEFHEEDQQFLVKKDTVIKEEDARETVKSHSETVKIKANDEQELSDSKVQERDLNVFSPEDVHEPEESFADTAKPEFSTDEEQSPKADESNISEQKTYEGKTKDEEKVKNFTDEAMKTEEQVAEQKAAHKKQNLLSGVGSKVKRQLAKVKKVITGKPGHTKPESPKA